MAGIGWRLERMLDRDSLGSTLGALLTGVAVTSGPWLLTSIVLVVLRLGAVGSSGVTDAERVITVVYATVIVLSAPIDIVLSRYASDRVYEQRRDRIAGPLRTTLAVSLVGFAVVGALAMRAIDARLGVAIPGILLAEVVGAQWLLLSAAGGLSSPAIILRAFAIGAPVSALGVLVLSHPQMLGSLGYLYGYGMGQVVTLGLLLVGTLGALPVEEDEDASMLPAFRAYWLLAAAALAFHAGLWVDKLVVFLLAGGTIASTYAAAAALAWLSVIPACAYLFVVIETVFHDRFRAYDEALHSGASLSELERHAADLCAEVGRTLRGTGAVQACVTLLCLACAPAISARVGGDASVLSWLLVGAALQVIGVSTMLMLYYLDLRREAFTVAATQLGANLAATLAIGAPSPWLGAGYAVGCGVTCAVALGLLVRQLRFLLTHTFQGQPYASED